MNKYIQALDVKIPIVNIKDNLFLIGPNRCNCELRKDTVMIRVGGGYQRF